MTIKLSATAIQDFKVCPVKYRLKTVDQIVPDVEADSLRIGTTWHKLRELAAKAGPGGKIAAGVEELNKRYEKTLPYKTPEEWACERQMLLAMFLCYEEYWKNQPLGIWASEQSFEMPLYNPMGLPLSKKQVVVTGRMDEVILYGCGADNLCVHEYKTTSDSIEADSDYWHRLQRDDQVSIYALAFRRAYNTTGNTLYDVVRKPRHRLNKGETVEHYGERLVEAISKEPTTYFARREIARTDQELREFEGELYRIYRTIAAMRAGNYWYHNFNGCQHPYPCVYRPYCFGNGSEENLPPGFVKLTINKK